MKSPPVAVTGAVMLKSSFLRSAVASARRLCHLRPRLIARPIVVLGIAGAYVLTTRPGGQRIQQRWRQKRLPERAVRRQSRDQFREHVCVHDCRLPVARICAMSACRSSVPKRVSATRCVRDRWGPAGPKGLSRPS